MPPRGEGAEDKEPVRAGTIYFAPPNYLLGVILTGASGDGARGLQTVHAAGGYTVVQHPEIAQAAMMPRAALEACPAATVLSLGQIGDLLGALQPGK